MGSYKKHEYCMLEKRKRIVITYIVLIIFLLISFIAVLPTKNRNSIENIIYAENSNADYKVCLKENDYFKDNYVEKNNQYIASLIDYIQIDFDYALEATNKKVDFECSYKVVADVKVKDKDNGHSLYEYTEDLIEEKTQSADVSSKIKIKESVKVNYDKYNKLIKGFLNSYDLENTNSTVTIKMYVNMENNGNMNKPVALVIIPLTNKTIAIDIECNSVNDNNTIKKNDSSKLRFFIAFVILAIDILVVMKLVRFLKDTETEQTVYKMELRKIMNNYGSYIQKIDANYEFKGYETIEIRSFEDLLQIRELVQSPILMLERKDETHFMVSTDSKLLYKFELNNGETKKRLAIKLEDKIDA